MVHDRMMYDVYFNSLSAGCRVLFVLTSDTEYMNYYVYVFCFLHFTMIDSCDEVQIGNSNLWHVTDPKRTMQVQLKQSLPHLNA